MAIAPAPIVLEDEHVVLRPTERSDAAGLYSALDDRDIWTWLPVRAPDGPNAMAGFVAAAMTERDAGLRFPWTVRIAGSGEVVGWTSYTDIQPAQSRIEIGWTVYAPRWQGTRINPATKPLLLRHAFDDLGNVRVTFKTDGRNVRSQAAIRRLGAVYEGTLRSFVVRPDGTRRDTVYFSILGDEWPTVRDGLVARLGDLRG